ncbi:hypothetical protein CCAL9344_02735 [Campylobacter sp. RM9344]|uniref:Uncharacterized protein n=1 Tax=Campylobacter californiensis TaxID=1032243 RepID=A0AAW3ZY83_9BACT|nr:MULTISPECIES: hypothetical protein [unclassified Campylobacter]MBE2985142.1 hypothetical protein [Campylobacter sp. RM6883]MBE2995732.1 hypothetical protein [Campylobacter sp. RM6913]MBE3029109.1 hypothetical protein [Campylobacter sp. RM9344]MBE3608100.1 hypothetical protein [Campylobacter sp. RM9337]QCD50347.1 hypothetical protein CCAL_0428 [Campylobacter sp. RM6914]
MKDAKNLIEHIYKNPLYKNLHKANDCRELVLLMSKTHQSLIAFCYLKHTTLYFALKHPLALQELRRDSSINMIKGLLKAHSSIKKESNLGSVEDIKFFVTKSLIFLQPTQNELKILCPKSKGKFANLAKDEKIHAKFEEIRAILQARNDKFNAN